MEASWASLVAKTVKNLPVTGNAGDLGMIPGLGKSPAEGNGNPLQCSGLENSIQSRVSQSQTRLRDFHSSGDQQGALPFVVKTGF